MIFVGAQSINTRGILTNKKNICLIFCGGGAAGAVGGTDNLCPQAPVATPLKLFYHPAKHGHYNFWHYASHFTHVAKV